jgi:hypothetical protein
MKRFALIAVLLAVVGFSTPLKAANVSFSFLFDVASMFGRPVMMVPPPPPPPVFVPCYHEEMTIIHSYPRVVERHVYMPHPFYPPYYY